MDYAPVGFPLRSTFGSGRFRRLCVLLLLTGGTLLAEETRDGADVAELLQGAKAGNTAALVELADHFLANPQGESDDAVPRDFPQLEKWLLAAATKGSAQAAYRLGWLYADNYERVGAEPAKAFKYYRQAAAAGDIQGMNAVATCYFHGTGTAADPTQAEHWWNEVLAKAGQDSPEGMQASTSLQLLAEARERQAELAALTKRAEAGDHEAQHALAQFLLDRSEPGTADHTEALRRLRQAAEGGRAAAQFDLALRLGMAGDKSAADWLAKAVAQDHPPALGHAGLQQLLGQGGLPRDPGKGIGLILRARLLGDSSAASTLMRDDFFPGLKGKEAGRLAFSQKPDDLAKLTAAAERGEAEAQYWLGAHHYTTDSARATTWYEKAAAQGHVVAMQRLSLAFAHGLGTPRHLEQAFFWANRAALLGHGETQWYLAEMYFKGEGTPKDEALAGYWYALVASSPSDAGQHLRTPAKNRLAEIKAKPALWDKVREPTFAAATRALLPSDKPPAPVAIAAAPQPPAKSAPAQPVAPALPPAPVVATAAPAAPVLTFEDNRKLAAQGDADAAYRAFQYRVKQIAQVITNNHVAKQNGQPVTTPEHPYGYLDTEMSQWAGALTRKIHVDGLALVCQWLETTQPAYAARALFLRREIAKLHPDLAFDSGRRYDALSRRSGWESTLTKLRTRLGAAELDDIEKKAAESLTAPVNLDQIAYSFLHGVRGYPKDVAAAFRLYQTAAEKGFALSQFNLGVCYLNGLGVAADPAAARAWIEKAAVQGHEPARQALAQFRQADPTAQYLAMAEAFAAEYRRAVLLHQNRGLPPPARTPRQTLAADLLALREQISGEKDPAQRQKLAQARGFLQLGLINELQIFPAEQLLAEGKAADALALLDKFNDFEQVPVLKSRALLTGAGGPRDYPRARRLLKGALATTAPGSAYLLGVWFADPANPQREELRPLSAHEPTKLPATWPQHADWDAAIWLTVESRWMPEGQLTPYAEAAEQSLAAMKIPAEGHAILATLADEHIHRLTAAVAAGRQETENLVSMMTGNAEKGPAPDPIKDNPILQQAALAEKALKGDAQAAAILSGQQQQEKAQRAAINGPDTAASRDFEESLRRARSQYDRQALTDLAERLEKGQGVPADPDRALALYKEAAGEGQNRRAELAVVRLQHARDAALSAHPAPPVPKAGPVKLPNLLFEAIPEGDRGDQAKLMNATYRIRSAVEALEREDQMRNFLNTPLERGRQALAQGKKDEAKTAWLQAAAAGTTAAVAELRKHFPETSVARPAYQPGERALWPGDAGWEPTHARFLEVSAGWKADRGQTAHQLAELSRAGLAEAAAFHATALRGNYVLVAPVDKPAEVRGASQLIDNIVELANRAIDLGHAETAWRLRAFHYFPGKTREEAVQLAMAKDPASADELLRAAKHGEVEAQVALAAKLGRTQPEQTAYWLGCAARNGHAGADLALAGLYAQGQGVPADSQQVFCWLARAAIKGRQEAQIILGDYLAGKFGGQAQPAFARFWYERAAAFGRDGDFLARLAMLRAAQIDAPVPRLEAAFAQAQSLSRQAVVPEPAKKN